MADENDGPITGAYRPIRRVEPPHAPLAGVLAASGERRVVLVDAEAARGRVFTSAQPTQHLLAAGDLVRRPAGHDLELPWCREPLERVLAARMAASQPLAGGELVTLAVSLLRGVAEAWVELPPGADEPRGSWWIADDGRPLLAPADAGETAAEQSRALLALASAHTRDRVLLRLLEDAREALTRPRALARTAEPLEDALFTACAPRAIESAPADGRAGRAPSAAEESAEPVRASLLHGLVERFADAPLADGVSDALDRVRATLRSAGGRGRRAPLLVGAAVAAAVLVGGFLWPAEPDPAKAAGASEQSASPSPDGASKSAASPEETSPEEEAPEATSASAEEPIAGATRLLGEIAECAAHGDPLCAGVRDDPAEPLPEALLTAGDAGPPVLLDDYGDVAVARLDAADGGILLQLVRVDGRWLLRAAHPVAG